MRRDGGEHEHSPPVSGCSVFCTYIVSTFTLSAHHKAETASIWGVSMRNLDCITLNRKDNQLHLSGFHGHWTLDELKQGMQYRLGPMTQTGKLYFNRIHRFIYENAQRDVTVQKLNALLDELCVSPK